MLWCRVLARAKDFARVKRKYFKRRRLLLEQFLRHPSANILMEPINREVSRLKPMARVIMLVDLDYYFAQCEEKRDQSLKEKPVVVCVYSGRTEESGVVSTANYMAREYGVRSGMPIFLAKSRLKDMDAVFLPLDRPYYKESSDRVMKILESHADLFEQAGIDEAYLDVTQRTQGSFESGYKLAQAIKDEVKAKEQLTCSIGLGPNKLVAKIAADYEKPDGLTMVQPAGVRSFLAPLPVSRLPGIGKKTNNRMKALGIETIGDLANYSEHKLAGVFGKRPAVYFHNSSQGIDDSPVKERGKAESISRIITLKEDSQDLAAIIIRMDRLCDDIHRKVIQEGATFKSVGVVAVQKNLRVRTRSKTLEAPTADVKTLKEVVHELFERLLSEANIEVRRAGVKVSGLAQLEEPQKRLTDFGIR